MGFELHTDRLRRETGADICCDVLRHNVSTKTRLAVLSAVHQTGAATPQTLAYTRLATHTWDARIKAVDSLLQRGNLMGETFRKQGLHVSQNRLFRVRLPLWSRRIRRLFDAQWWQWTEVECYEFWAGQHLYGTVVEIKRPTRRQKLTRPKLGSWRFWSRRGVDHTIFAKQLQADRPVPAPRPARIRARVHGWNTSLLLFVSTLKHTKTAL